MQLKEQKLLMIPLYDLVWRPSWKYRLRSYVLHCVSATPEIEWQAGNNGSHSSKD